MNLFKPNLGETMNNEVGNDGGSTEIPRNVKVKKGWKKVLLEKVWSWLTHKDKDKWLKDMRGNLSLVATVIATITFQMALNPPGGVRPAKDDGDTNPDIVACTVQSNDILHLCPGMCFTLTSLAITYILGVQMVTPDPVWGPAQDFQRKCVYVWIGLMFFLAVLLTLRLIIWVFFIKRGKIKSKLRKGEYSIPPA
ncbi:hypothetical protein P8452_73859 [Trifolium repens]|nr:hypothetical protein P8452_73859 [Trifolium repens]